MPSRSSMVRVTLTNHRRLCLFPTDVRDKAHGGDGNLTSRARVVSSPGEREVPTLWDREHGAPESLYSYCLFGVW